MKLARVGPLGREIPAVLTEDGRLLDARSLVDDLDGSALGGEVLGRLARAERDGGLPEVAGSQVRYGACIARPGKVVCIGLNYRDHAEETGAPIPAEPVVFLKASDTVVGAGDDVLIPLHSTKTDWEVELAVVIGEPARYLSAPEDARRVIAGYAISDDVSEREFQLERGGQWDKGKSCETFNPLGPWLVTADEIPDPQALGLRLWVDGQLRQDGSTTSMIFGVDYLVWYLSQFMVLYPGDVINTGTPAGVALGRPDPKPYLRPGNVVECEIDGLGHSKHPFRSADIGDR